MNPQTYFDFKEQGRIGQIQRDGYSIKKGMARFDILRWTGAEAARERARCSKSVWDTLGLYDGCEVALDPTNRVLARVDSRGGLIFPNVPT